MYRAITFIFCAIMLTGQIITEVKKALEEYLLNSFTIRKHKSDEIYLNGENVEYVIRDLVVAEKVSDIAAIKEVREFAVAQQQKMGKKRELSWTEGYWHGGFSEGRIKNIYDSR